MHKQPKKKDKTYSGRYKIRPVEEYEKEKIVTLWNKDRLRDWRFFILVVFIFLLTLWVLSDVFFKKSSVSPVYTSGDSTVSTETSTVMDYVDAGELPDSVGVLPPGADYTEVGDNTYRLIAPVNTEQVGEGTEKVFRYTVEIENPLDTNAYGGDSAVAMLIESTLSNPLSWIKDPRFAFQHVENRDEANLHIQIASPNTVHRYCGHDIPLETSCFTTEGNRVILNEARWVRGAITFAGDLGSYRQYLINHEVGHALGYDHVPCPANGELAPVMMQQTLSLSNSVLESLADPADYRGSEDNTCRFNAWPYPTG